MLYGIVYKITNKINQKSYIGKTTLSLKQRWYFHCRSDSECPRLKNAIQKYGKDSFTIDAIASSWDRDSLKQTEILLIKQENTVSPNGYNLTGGGEGDDGKSSQTREKHRVAMLGNTRAAGTIWTPERRLAHSIFMTGKQFRLGQKPSESTKNKRSAAMKECNLKKYGITFNGEILTMTGWAERVGIHRVCLQYRINRWGLERALTTPARKDDRRGKPRAAWINTG